jgi:hypothetical protein
MLNVGEGRRSISSDAWVPNLPDFKDDSYSTLGPPNYRQTRSDNSGLSMTQENTESARRVTFERPLSAHIMAIDGTWKRACTIKHVSETGAALLVESSIEGLALKEFFLLLSSTGLAYRRCELNWVNGGEIGGNFLRQRNKRAKSKEPSDVA